MKQPLISMKNIVQAAKYQFRPKHIVASKIVSSVIVGFLFAVLLVFADQSLYLAFLGFLLGYKYPDLWLKETKKSVIILSLKICLFS